MKLTSIPHKLGRLASQGSASSLMKLARAFKLSFKATSDATIHISRCGVSFLCSSASKTGEKRRRKEERLWSRTTMFATLATGLDLDLDLNLCSPPRRIGAGSFACSTPGRGGLSDNVSV